MTRPSFEVADVLREHLGAYQAARRLSPAQHKAVRAIMSCRTAALGGHADCCASCGQALRVSYNSCRDRHCPKCQWAAQQRWVERRLGELLPVPYYHLVFTLPQELNALASSNEAKLYGLLSRAGWETLRQLCAQPKWLGAQPGMIAVLHTWGQNLSLHPHLHCIVPAGGLAPDGVSWVKSPRGSHFLPVRVLSRLFRGKFLHRLRSMYAAGELEFYGQAEALREGGEFRLLLRRLYQKDWIAYAKRPFGGPGQVISYLGRYTHRVAISNRRILSIAGGKVRFAYKDYRQGGKAKAMTLDALEFIRRFLQHCLPKGFQKIRYYGILSTRNRREKLAALQRSLGYVPPEAEPPVGGASDSPALECPSCGKALWVRIALPPLRQAPGICAAAPLTGPIPARQRAPPASSGAEPPAPAHAA